jgi:hypothetical protein
MTRCSYKDFEINFTPDTQFFDNYPCSVCTSPKPCTLSENPETKAGRLILHHRSSLFIISCPNREKREGISFFRSILNNQISNYLRCKKPLLKIMRLPYASSAPEGAGACAMPSYYLCQGGEDMSTGNTTLSQPGDATAAGAEAYAEDLKERSFNSLLGFQQSTIIFSAGMMLTKSV